MEEVHPQPEHRSQARYAVDAEASLVIVNHGGALRARMFELSLDGCRVRADRYSAFATHVGVEIAFKINGIAFRLGGTMQWFDAQQTAGIQFSPMAARRREALEQLLDELETTKQAEEQAENKAHAEAEVGKPAAGLKPGILGAGAKGGILSMPPGLRRNDNPPLGAPPGPGPGSSPNRTRDIKPPIPISRPAHSKAGQGYGAPVSKPAEAHKPPGQPTGRERRDQARQAVDTHATVFFIDVRAQITGRIHDLSVGGCRIRTNERFPVGIYRRVETEFKLDGLPFRLAGVVQALHDKFTVGIRFLNLSQRKQDQLAQLMKEIEEMKTAGNREQGIGSRE